MRAALEVDIRGMQSVLASKKNLAWTCVQEPTSGELAELIRTTGVLPADAEFIVQNYQRAEITVRPEYLLILMHVPVFNRQTRVTTGASLYVIVKDGQVWTLQYEPIVVLDKVIQDWQTTPEKVEEYFSDGPLGLALYLINVMYSSAFHKLDRLTKHVNIAEDAVFRGNERKMVEEVAVLVRDVMDFRKVMRPQQQLFAAPPIHAFLTSELATQWRRLHGQVNKIWEILESLSESVHELSATNETLLQHKQNQLLRLLTYYSIFSIPVFILVSPFNPRSPDASGTDPYIYWGVLSVLIIILVLIFLRFRGKQVF